MSPFRLKSKVLSSVHLNFNRNIHRCSLPPHEDVIVRYICSGTFVSLRRFLKQLMMANEKFPITMRIFKSITVVRAEQERHLRKHIQMIHPFSTWCYYWSMLQFIVHLICFLVLPFEISSQSSDISGFLLCFDFVFYADIAICFFTGQFNKNRHHVTMNQKVIAKKYLSTYFIPDLLGSLSVYTLSQIVTYADNEQGNVFWMSKTVLYLKLIRIRNLCRYLYILFEYVDGDQQKHTIIKTAILAILFFMWYSSVALLLIVQETPKYVNLHKKNFDALIFLTTKTMHLFLLYGYERNQKIWERSSADLGLTVISYTLGLVFNVFLMAYIMYAIDTIKSTTYKHLKNVRELDDFCQTKNLSEKLSKRVQEMYAFRYKQRFFRDDYIMATISQQLKDTIDMQICYDLLGEVKIFSDIPICILSRLVALMEPVYFLNNDVIVRDGEVGDSMFFISFGSVAVYASNGIEVCHLDQGTNFGEIAITLPNQKRVATVVAIESCELYKLTKKSFEYIINPYPEINQRIQSVALSRLEKATKFVQQNPVQYTDD